MINSKPKQKKVLSEKGMVDLIIASVHNKIFPTILVLIFVVFMCTMWLHAPASLLVRVALIVCSIPAFVLFALKVYGISDAAPNMYEFYKRFKQEHSAESSNKIITPEELKD
ncbi:MAG: hypothetical protein WC748_10140 [Legionellales bacterium]